MGLDISHTGIDSVGEAISAVPHLWGEYVE